MAQTKPVWVRDFQGMNQRQDADKIPVNSSPLLVNISLSKPGSLLKRRGSELLATAEAGAGIQGGISYRKVDGTQDLRIIRDGDIEVYDASTNTYSITAAGAFTPGSKVVSVNYKERVYHISPDDFLKYETGGATTDVGVGADRTTGTAIGVAQNTLFVAVDNKVYYSLFDSSNNVPGDQLWEDSEASLANSTRFFTRPNKVVTLFSYGTTGSIYAFTDTDCVTFDVAQADNAFGPVTVFNIGCAGLRAVTECNGWMIWMDPQGRIWGWGGAGTVMPFSWDLEDDANQEAIINAISSNDLTQVVAGTSGNEFWFDVGSVTTFGRNLTNVRIKGLLSQDLTKILWSVDTYPYRASIFITAKTDDQERAHYGAVGVNNVYRIGVGANDDDAAINAFALTPFFNFGELKTYQMKGLMMKFRPQPNENTYLRVAYSTDINTNYSDISDPDNGISSAGVIDMYDPQDGLRSKILEVLCPQEFRGHNVSIEIGNSQLNESFELSGIGMRLSVIELDARPGVL